MADALPLLTTRQMADFVRRGFLRFESIVPGEFNERFVEEGMAGKITSNPAGTPLSQCYQDGSTAGKILALPQVRGIIESLVGPAPVFDHQFFHIRMPDGAEPSQHYHQDSTIDTRLAFDIQLMYFPRAVTREMGGTRFLPGSHFRTVNEASISRYQNFVGQQHAVCPAGSIYVLHHGMWHGAGFNASDQPRFMFKVRLNPQVRQCRLWDTSDLPADAARHKEIFSTYDVPGEEDLQALLCLEEDWFEFDTSRLEMMNRIRLWRYLLGDDTFDAHYWMTRIENVPA